MTRQLSTTELLAREDSFVPMAKQIKQVVSVRTGIFRNEFFCVEPCDILQFVDHPKPFCKAGKLVKLADIEVMGSAIGYKGVYSVRYGDVLQQISQEMPNSQQNLAFEVKHDLAREDDILGSRPVLVTLYKSEGFSDEIKNQDVIFNKKTYKAGQIRQM